MSHMIHKCYKTLYRKLSNSEKRMLNILISDGQYRAISLAFGQYDYYKTNKNNLPESYLGVKLKEYKTNTKQSLDLAIEKLEEVKE